MPINMASTLCSMKTTEQRHSSTQYLKIHFLPHVKHYFFTATTNQLILFTNKTTVYSEKYKKLLNKSLWAKCGVF